MNIAKILAEYIKEKTDRKNVYYSSLPPGGEAVCVYEYDSGKGHDPSLPDISQITFKIVCRAEKYDECRTMADEMTGLFKNAGNELWGIKPLVTESCEFIVISPRGTPDIKRETDSGNVRIALHFTTWARAREEAV